ncbi:MAG: hypothetical protein H6Q00_1998 [Holophagaceae bacterium]|nr:hypothetical protein [Holophagaceae bacterium]
MSMPVNLQEGPTPSGSDGTGSAQGSLPIQMSPAEVELFTESLRGVRRYFEYGTGGSTTLAFRLLQEAQADPAIYGVDTSAAWIELVSGTLDHHDQVHLEHIDLGPVGDWGYPVNRRPRPIAWRRYPTAIRKVPQPETLNLVLIDGRFRVACFIQALLACATGTTILVHDYRDRPGYQVMESWAEKVRSVESLAVFRKGELTWRDRLRLHAAFCKFWIILQ